MRRKSDLLTFALLLLTLSTVSACSSKKYDSWSDCMSGEINKTRLVPAAANYCDSNYDMTERERRARLNWYCQTASYEPVCQKAGYASEAASAAAVASPSGEPSAFLSNEPAVPELSSPTSNSVIALIPAAFHGDWNDDVRACGTGLNDGRLVVSASQINFYESEATVKSVRVNSPRSITVTGSFTGEGESWNRTLTMNLSGSGRELTIDNFKRYRCP